MSAETPGTETHHYWSASRNASQFIKPCGSEEPILTACVVDNAGTVGPLDEASVRRIG